MGLKPFVRQLGVASDVVCAHTAKLGQAMYRQTNIRRHRRWSYFSSNRN